MNAYERKAVAELVAATTHHDEVMATTHNAPYIRGNAVDLARLEASNRLRAAQWPFLTGKYTWPSEVPSGYGL